MKYKIIINGLMFTLGLILVLSWTAFNAPGDKKNKEATASQDVIQQGKYIVLIGGCNDCHTVGYMEVDGKMAESEWLTGNPIGFRGPWGTTYPPNLRIFVQETPEDEFVTIAKTRKQNPPMPWPSLNNMKESDLRAVYRFIQSLGPKGERAPEYVPPDEEPQTAYFEFWPKHMERMGKAGTR